MENIEFTIKNGVLTGYENPGLDVTIPDGVTMISNAVFHSCTGLTRVTIPEGVVRIGEYAFAHCSRLTDVNLPASLTDIGDSAFLACRRLKKVRYAGTLKQWRTMRIGCETRKHLGSVLQFTGKEECTGYHIRDGVLVMYGGPGGRADIPDGVKAIGDNAFLHRTNLTGATIPGTVARIGAYAFQGCTGLKEMTVPESVGEICSCAFLNCTGLTSVTIPAGIKKIGTGTFAGCTGLRDIYFLGTRERWDEIHGWMAIGPNGPSGVSMHFEGTGGDHAPGNTEPSIEDAIKHLEKFRDGECYTDFHRNVCRLAVEALRDKLT